MFHTVIPANGTNDKIANPIRFVFKNMTLRQATQYEPYEARRAGSFYSLRFTISAVFRPASKAQ